MFDLRKVFAVPKDFLKSKNYCTIEQSGLFGNNFFQCHMLLVGTSWVFWMESNSIFSRICQMQIVMEMGANPVHNVCISNKLPIKVDKKLFRLKVLFIYFWKESFVSLWKKGNFLADDSSKNRTNEFVFFCLTVQCNLDLVTLLVSAKTVTKLNNVAKSQDFI